jgi:tRNA A-37 threonylcarbamoyl transferase component Bud32
MTPDEPKALSDEVYVNTTEGAFKTKQLMDRAMEISGYKSGQSGYFEIADYVVDTLRKNSAAFGDPRSMNMVYKFALYFAIDLGLDFIDEDCVSRALALVAYRQKAIAFLQPIEARNEEGRLLQEITREIRQQGGKMNRRDLIRNFNYNKYKNKF